MKSGKGVTYIESKLLARLVNKPPREDFLDKKTTTNFITLNIFHAISLTYDDKWNESEYIWTRFQNNKNRFIL